MQSNSFLESMQSHSSEKLKEIVGKKRDNYTADALAAAEEELKRRNVKFSSPEPDENIDMTYDEIREDIRKRRVKGQPMSSIREYYKSCGVDIDMPEIKGSEDTAPGQPWSYGKLRLVFMLVGALAAIIMHLNESGDHGTMKFIFIVLAVVAGIWFLLSFRKK